MTDRDFNPHAHGARLLPHQWTALKRSVIAQARADRARMIRGALAALQARWRRWRERQQAHAALSLLSDHELRDVGLTRLGIKAAINRDEIAALAEPCSPHHNWRTKMSKAYWIVRVSVRDEARYPEYLAAAKPAFEKFGARFIVRGGDFEAMEGSARDRNVVVEFADRAVAAACYCSPDYEAAKAIRQRCADTDFIIIDGV